MSGYTLADFLVRIWDVEGEIMARHPELIPGFEARIEWAREDRDEVGPLQVKLADKLARDARRVARHSR